MPSPSTTATSAAVSPYSSYTSASACGVPIRHLDPPLERRLPAASCWDAFGGEPFVQINACGSLRDERDHPVVPRAAGATRWRREAAVA